LIVIGAAFPNRATCAGSPRPKPGAYGRLIEPVKNSVVALLSTSEASLTAPRLCQDEAAQAVHYRHLTRASIQRSVGLAGSNRTAAPIRSRYTFSPIARLPTPVAEIGRWRRPSRLAKMLWAGCVPLSAAGMARRYPELFPSAEGRPHREASLGGEAAILDALHGLADGMPGRARSSPCNWPDGPG
jgi:hypothetical protein